MRYSVWNWNSQQYDIYESPNGEMPGQRPAPRRKVNDPRGRGYQLESLLPILPAGARLTGHSDLATGRVAIHHSSPAVGLGLGADTFFTTNPWTTVGLLIGGTWLGYRLLIAIAKSF